MNNKEKQKYHAYQHYLRNKDKIKERAKINNEKSSIVIREYIRDYLLEHPCVDCGNPNIIVLEFDHVRGEKKYELARMKFCSYSLKTIQKEIDKCEVRCANCHRIVTYNRRNNITGYTF